MRQRRKALRVLCWGLALAASPGAAQAQPYFTEVTQQAFTGPMVAGLRSAAWGDYDNDGRPDLLITENWGPAVYLWHNEGDGRFTDQTAVVAGGSPGLNWGGGGSVFGDYDNDGDLDFQLSEGSFFLRFDGRDPAYVGGDKARNPLLRNDRAIFTEVGVAAGLTDLLPTDNAVWLDYDRDGHLDLYTGNLAAGDFEAGITRKDSTVRNELYRNLGDGTFRRVTREVGLDLQLTMNGGTNGGIAAADLSGDGWPDLYVGAVEGAGRLFLNDQHGGFREATAGQVAGVGEAFGVAVGDIDNDLDLDLFQAAGGTSQDNRSFLLLNLGEGTFIDATDAVGLGGWEAADAYGPGFADIDNDGDLDLLLTRPKLVMINRGDGTFIDQTEQSGIVATYIGLCAAFGDYDLDGYLDVLFAGTACHLYRNLGGGNHWLQVEPVGVRSNRCGIGARLIATAGDLTQLREVLGGRGFEQDEMIAHFGLGQRTQVDRLEIRWPSGQVDVLTDIPADQRIRVIEGQGRYSRAVPLAWAQPPVDSVAVGSSFRLSGALAPARFDADAVVTSVTADLSQIGGDAAYRLAAAEDGTYAVDAQLPPAAATGLRTWSVLVEQSTSVGPRWSRLSHRLVLLPAADVVVYRDGESGEWPVSRRVNATLDSVSTALVLEGKASLAVTGSYSELVWRAPAPVAPTGFTLRLAFHPGSSNWSTRPYLTLVAGDEANTTTWQLLEASGSRAAVDLSLSAWQTIEVPLAQVSGTITQIRLRGSAKGTFYLDDIRLVAARPSSVPGTAVLESQASALPTAFSLAQNYPNPFNGSTVIRFSLPRAGEVEAFIYDLVGQRVAILAHGSRSAGTHLLAWDGRDDQGRLLASGVYLCRLRVGGQQQTRKIVVVR